MGTKSGDEEDGENIRLEVSTVICRTEEVITDQMEENHKKKGANHKLIKMTRLLSHVLRFVWRLGKRGGQGGGKLKEEAEKRGYKVALKRQRAQTQGRAVMARNPSWKIDRDHQAWRLETLKMSRVARWRGEEG